MFCLEKLGLISNKETANSDISEEDSFNFLQLASAQVEQELDVDVSHLFSSFYYTLFNFEFTSLFIYSFFFVVGHYMHVASEV